MKQALTAPWVFDETQDFGWANADDIETYDKRARVNPAIERERLLDLGVSSQHTIMDIGCGTGGLVLEAAKLCKRAIALDVSKPMLDYLKRKAKELNLGNIDTVNQGFLAYEHKGELIDFVFSQRTLHHLPDFWKVQALEGVANILKPGGVLFVRDILFSFNPRDTNEAIERWINGIAVDTADGFPRTFFEEDVREQFITYTWLFEAMLDRVGFDIKSASYGDYDVYAKYVCVKRSAA